MKKIVLFGLLLVSFVGYSQVPNIEDLEDGDVVIQGTDTIVQFDEQEPDENYIYVAVEVMPEYPGGMNEFRKFIAENFRNPKVDKNLKGNIIVQFVVEKDGSLSDIKVIRDLGYGTGEEAVRVVGLAEKWKPGIQNGKPVRVNYNLPINIDIKVAE